MLIDLLRLGLQKMQRTLLQEKASKARALVHWDFLLQGPFLQAYHAEFTEFVNKNDQLKKRIADLGGELRRTYPVIDPHDLDLERTVALIEELKQMNAQLVTEVASLSRWKARRKAHEASRVPILTTASFLEILRGGVAPSEKVATQVSHLRDALTFRQQTDTFCSLGSVVNSNLMQRVYRYLRPRHKLAYDFDALMLIRTDNADNLTTPLAGHLSWEIKSDPSTAARRARRGHRAPDIGPYEIGSLLPPVIDSDSDYNPTNFTTCSGPILSANAITRCIKFINGKADCSHDGDFKYLLSGKELALLVSPDELKRIRDEGKWTKFYFRCTICTPRVSSTNWHFDHALRTMNISLSPTSEISGGRLLFVTSNGEIVSPEPEVGHATIHTNNILHAVEPVFGIRYRLVCQEVKK